MKLVAPVNLWQSRQWQALTASGLALKEYRTAPQRQPPWWEDRESGDGSGPYELRGEIPWDDTGPFFPARHAGELRYRYRSGARNVVSGTAPARVVNQRPYPSPEGWRPSGQ